MENATFYSERQVGDLVAIKESGCPGKKRTDGDDVIGHFIHPANARNRILHTGLGKNRMAYQIRKPANRPMVGNDALDGRDYRRAPSREPANFHPEVVRPIDPRIKDNVKSRLVGTSQLISP